VPVQVETNNPLATMGGDGIASYVVATAETDDQDARISLTLMRDSTWPEPPARGRVSSTQRDLRHYVEQSDQAIDFLL
jgi:hypothetical protein